MKWLLVLLSLLSITFGCKDPFDPKVSSGTTSFLVVEGYLNGNGLTVIKLSRTIQLNDSAVVHPELNAQVRIEGSDGTAQTLVATGSGNYTISNLLLASSHTYRLYIKTTNNKEYRSAFVEYKPTPPIDRVTWKEEVGAVTLYASTHDPVGNTRYYRWEYDETWQFRSEYHSDLEYRNGQFVNRDMSLNIRDCWKSLSSTRIILGSSAKLQQDVIDQQPLVKILNDNENSWKLSVRYSILVRQYAITEEAFDYWQNLLKITEQLGSLFDAQPVELRGNLSNIADPNETVLGYISAGTVEEKRIFINRNELQNWPLTSACTIENVSKTNTTLIQSLFTGKIFEPLTYAEHAGLYYYAQAYCVDCRTRGTNVKPSFW